tara:strand:- start:231 stop:500 length:270 start_codon:yes stop_codon:yes gene_type:complete
MMGGAALWSAEACFRFGGGRGGDNYSGEACFILPNGLKNSWVIPLKIGNLRVRRRFAPEELQLESKLLHIKLGRGFYIGTTRVGRMVSQ